MSGLWLLAWPALFLSLGWNFLEFGLDPPGGGGPEWGWLICAIVFGLMGGVPLLLVLPELVRSVVPIGEAPRPRPSLAATPNMRADLAAIASSFGRSTVSGGARMANPPSAEPPASDGRLVDALERLAALRARGALTESEFAEAKRRLLDDEP